MRQQRPLKRRRTAAVYVEDAMRFLKEAEGVEHASVWRCPCPANGRCTAGDPRPAGACSVAAVYGRNRDGKLAMGFTLNPEDPKSRDGLVFTAYTIEFEDDVTVKLAFAVQNGNIGGTHFRELAPVLRTAFRESLT